MRRKFPCLIVATAIFASSVLSGCELMPVEEEPPAIPIVKEYSGPQYEEATVLRGDLILKRDIDCTYSATISESYAFSMEFEGAKIGAVYVEEGQTVTKGTLLAELDNTSLNNQIKAQQIKIDDQNLKIAQMKEDRELDLMLQDALIAQYSSQLRKVQAEIDALTAWEADPTGPRPVEQTLEKLQKQEQTMKQNVDKQIANKQSVSDNYETRLLNADNSLNILLQRLEELQLTLASRQLYAQMDGVVTHADTIIKEPKVKNRATVTVTDMASVSFHVNDVEDASFLTVGMEVQLKIGSTFYPAVVTEKLPVEPESTDEVARLQLTTNDAPQLRIGYKAVTTVVEASKTDVLYLDASTIKSSVNGEYVNIIGQDGLKTQVEVTTGIICDDMVEIVSGLAEGDKVIKG